MPPPLWLLKAILCFAVLGDLLFMREYWAGTRGGWRRDSIGLTLMLEAMAFCATLSLIILAAFWNLDRFTSAILGWVEDGLLFSCGLIYWWRTWVFRKERDTPRVMGAEYASIDAGIRESERDRNTADD